MKVRKDKSQDKPKKNKVVKGASFDQLSLIDKMEVAKNTVDREYSDFLKGDVSSADVLIKMMQDSYINSYPAYVRKAVMNEVSKLMNERFKAAINDVIETAERNGTVTREGAINQIKESADFVKNSFPKDNIPEFFKVRMQQVVNEYIQEYEESIKKTKQSAETVYNENTDIKTEKETILETEIEKAQEVSQITELKKTKSKEEIFIEDVAAFTNNFAFLAEDVKSYLANNGHRYNFSEGEKSTPKKFKSVDDAMNFIRIQSIVRKMMPSDTYNEEKAVKRIIDSMCKTKQNESNSRANKTIWGKMSKLNIEDVINDMHLESSDRKLIENVLKPICSARLEVINKNKEQENEEYDR